MFKILLVVILPALNVIPATAAPGDVDPDFRMPRFSKSGPAYLGLGSLAIAPQDKIYLGGSFLGVDGVELPRLARLNGDGSLDRTFIPYKGFRTWAERFTVIRGGRLHVPFGGGIPLGRKKEEVLPVGTLIRLRWDGTREPIPGGDFRAPPAYTSLLDPGENLYEKVTAENLFPTANIASLSKVQVQQDGRVLLRSSVYGPQPEPTWNAILRFHPDGSEDEGFRPVTGLGGGGGFLLCPDGSILHMHYKAGEKTGVLRRVGPDGRGDALLAGPIRPTSSIALQEDGKILFCAVVNGDGHVTQTDVALCRLNPDGSEDVTFPKRSLRRSLCGVALQADGKILLYGSKAIGTGRSEPVIYRLLNDPPQDELDILKGRISWLRGGAAPAVTQAIFELSTDGGANWRSLPQPVRKQEGWVLDGVELGEEGIVRAQGQTTAGNSYGLVSQEKRFSF